MTDDDVVALCILGLVAAAIALGYLINKAVSDVADFFDKHWNP